MRRPTPISTIKAFIAERDRCRDPGHKTKDVPLHDAFFCNTNSMWDTVSQELKCDAERLCSHRMAVTRTIIALIQTLSGFTVALLVGPEGREGPEGIEEVEHSANADDAKEDESVVVGDPNASDVERAQTAWNKK